MSRRLNRPFFPAPPDKYSKQYFAELVRAFTVFLAQDQNPGDARHTTLTLTALPENDIGLEPGALYQEDGTLVVALAYKAKPLGSEAIGGTGTVDVTLT